MTMPAELKVLFVAGFGPIVTEPRASQALYLDTLKLPLKAEAANPDYFHGESLDGVRHFALWPLRSAAQSCFGTEVWPSHVPAPHASISLTSKTWRRPAQCSSSAGTRCWWKRARSRGDRR